MLKERWLLCLGVMVSLVTLFADQLSKHYVLFVMEMPLREPVPVTGFFNLAMVWNRGVSFGLFAEDGPWRQWKLIALAAVLSAGMLWWLYKKVTVRHEAVAIGMVLGGAVGNVIDRLRFGAVADFLDFHVAGFHWPAFNIADSAICIGVAILLLGGILPRRSSLPASQ